MLHKSLPDVFLDTDVAFDIISKREPHYTTSVKLLNLAAQGIIRLLLSESSLATLLYLSFDIYKLENSVSKLRDFISACELIHSGKSNAIKALESPFKDKEDALQYYTAIHAKAKYFITRNIKDFVHKDDTLAVYTPAQFIKIIDVDAIDI